MPSLSVVIPCYNAMPYIKRVIDSVLTQSYKYIDWVEVIVVDDCSTDDSCAYVEKMAREAQSINEKVTIDLVCRQENSGDGALPRNDGILRAKGDYLFLIDSDDWFSPNSLDRMVRHAVEWESDILLCKPVGENGRTPQLEMFRKSEPNIDIYTSAACIRFSNLNLYRTKFLQDNQILNPSIGRVPAEDWSFIIEAYLRAKTISIAADYVYYHILYRGDGVHLGQKLLLGASYTSEEWHRFWEQIFTVIEQYADLSKIYFKLIPRICTSRSLMLNLHNMFSGSEPPENFLPIIALWNKWFDLEQIRIAKRNIGHEYSILIQAAQTENLEIIKAALETVNLYRQTSCFPDECLTVSSDSFTVSLEHSSGTYECDISKEIRFSIKDFTPHYENGQFNFVARVEDYRSYLSENASINLVFFDEKNNYREAFPMAKTRISDAELTVRCTVDPCYFRDKYELANIRWDLYIEISSSLIGTRNIRVGNQGNKDALNEVLRDSLISLPFFTFRGYLSPANNIHFRQSPFPTSKVTNLSCSYDPASQKLAMQGMLESVVDFHGDEEICLIIHSATKNTVLSHLATAELRQGQLSWRGEFSVTDFLGLEPGKVRWDLSLQVKSFRLGVHSIRLGQQAEIAPLMASIDALQLTKNGYRLKCYLSAYNNIHFRQVPVSKVKPPVPAPALLARVKRKLKRILKRIAKKLLAK